MTARRNPEPPTSMTSEQFLAWVADHDVANVELIDGEVVAMAGGTRSHTDIKGNVYRALGDALAGQVPCRAYVDGLSVVISEKTTHIPDVVVDCAPDKAGEDLIAVEPVIVVEVLSQSTSRKDTDLKLMNYFGVASIIHYLIVNGFSRRVVHHRRDGEGIRTSILADGGIALDPPGISLDIADFWRGLPDQAASA